MWRKHKTQFNRSRLREQIAWCNRLASKDKGSYCTSLITANCDDPKKLWQSLRKVSHRTSETILLVHSSDKSLADTFASFFTNKISKIRDRFPSSGSFNDAPDSVPPRSVSASMSLLLNHAHWTPYQHSSLRIVLIYSFRLLPSW